MPQGLVKKTVCADNGLVPVSPFNPQAARGANPTPTLPVSQAPTACPHTLTELFISGTEPQRFDDWHQAIALDRRNGLRAGQGCPLEFVAFQTFTHYPAEAVAWANKQGVPQPPEITSPLCPNQQINLASQQSGEATSAEFPQGPPHSAQALIFTSPDQGSTFRLAPNIPADKQKIRISVRPVDGVAVQQVSLLINGQPLADGPETMWQMTPGEYTFEAIGRDPAGNKVTANKVTVKIVE
jgi:hypothetical protein